MWINESSLVVYNYIYEIRNDFETVMLPAEPTNLDLESIGVYLVYVEQPPAYNPITQNLIALPPAKVDNQWVQGWEVQSATPEEIAQREQAAKQSNKEAASSLLQATDWTATVDISNPQYSDPHLGNQSEFLAYRSQVRKIAINPPVSVDRWPDIPVEVWIDA